MHRNGKPVGKCHGCGLNFRDHCGVFEDPRGMWTSRRSCPGYRNEQMLAEYTKRQAREQAESEQPARRADDREHHNGDRHVIMAAK